MGSEQVDSLSSKFDVLSSQVDTLRKDIEPVLLAQNMKTVEEENVATAPKPAPITVGDLENFAKNIFPKQYRPKKAEYKHVENQRRGRKKSEENRQNTWT